jgi:hypothetical protein
MKRLEKKFPRVVAVHDRVTKLPVWDRRILAARRRLAAASAPM